MRVRPLNIVQDTRPAITSTPARTHVSNNAFHVTPDDATACDIAQLGRDAFERGVTRAELQDVLERVWYAEERLFTGLQLALAAYDFQNEACSRG